MWAGVCLSGNPCRWVGTGGETARSQQPPLLEFQAVLGFGTETGVNSRGRSGPPERSWDLPNAQVAELPVWEGQGCGASG